MALRKIIWCPTGSLAALMLALAACTTHVAVPTDSASPDVVLNAYLSALVAGDCATDAELAVGDGNGLCGHVEVRSYGVLGDPSRVAADRLIYATSLTTTGSADGSSPGTSTWFFSLIQQPSGVWQVAAVGSGP